MWTTTKLAKAAGVDPSAIRQLLISGSLQGQKFGRDWLISDEEAQRYITQRLIHGRLPPKHSRRNPT